MLGLLLIILLHFLNGLKVGHNRSAPYERHTLTFLIPFTRQHRTVFQKFREATMDAFTIYPEGMALLKSFYERWVIVRTRWVNL